MIRNIFQVLYNIVLYAYYLLHKMMLHLQDIMKSLFDVPQYKTYNEEDSFDEIDDDIYMEEDVEDDDEFTPYDGPVSMTP